MKHLLMGAAALALLAGCNKADEPKSGGEVKIEAAEARSGNAAMAAEALTAMSLNESASGILSFADKSVDGANATFTDVTITGEDALKAGSLVFEGLDMTDGKATFGKMSLNDIVVSEDDDATVNLGKIEIVNPSPELSNWLASSLNGQEAPFPSFADISFDSWSLSGLSGNFDDGGDTGTFGIDKIEISQLGADKVGAALISGIKLDVDSGGDVVKINLGSMSMSNLNTKFLQVIEENAGLGEEALVGALMSAVYDNPMDPGYDSVNVKDFTVEAAGASFAMPSLSASVERNSAGQPVKFVTKPFTMSLNADAEGGEAGAALLQGLSLLNYEGLTLKGEGLATYDPDKDIVEFDAGKNYLELVDGARFSYGGKLEGYAAYSRAVGSSMDFGNMSLGGDPDPDAMIAAMGNLVFHNFEFSIDDDSLLNRAFNAAATAQGQDPAEMKSQIGMGLAMAPMMVQGSGIDVALVTEATTALSEFIADGGKLTFKIAPKTPLAVSSIMENPDPSLYTKEALGFSATHK